jgi:hypothetical protein
MTTLAKPTASPSVQAMSGVSYIVDERGQKTAAVIDLRKHARLWEDFCDSATAKKRGSESRESLAEVRQKLKAAAKNG